MSENSEVAVLDVLYKNEACHQDMLDIMKCQQQYLVKDFSGCVPSGGDLLTCERQRCAQRHVMDSDTKEKRLELLEPRLAHTHVLFSGICMYTVHICDRPRQNQPYCAGPQSEIRVKIVAQGEY